MKTKLELSYSYEIVTHESAEDGEAAERGFYEPGGWKYPLPEFGGRPIEEAPKAQIVSAREALEAITDLLGGIDSAEPCGDSLDVYPCDGSTNFRTGAETRIHAHVKGDARLIAALAHALKDA
jgi:hypothetical protein